MKNTKKYLVTYDENENYIRDFENRQECANYFNTTKENIDKHFREKKEIKFKGEKYKIYKMNENVTNKELYESINTIKKDLKVEGKIHNLLNGGYETLINKQANKKVLDYILELNDFDIGFVKFNLEKKSEL